MKIDWTKVKEGITTMDVLKEENKEQRKEIERLENIIKEVREYIKTKYIAQGVLISYEVNNLLYELENILKGSDKE